MEQKIPSRSLDEIKITLHDHLRGARASREASKLTVILTDANDLKPWADRYAAGDGEVVMDVHFSTIIRYETLWNAAMREASGLKFVGRYSNDKYVLGYLGPTDRAGEIGQGLQENLNKTIIPNQVSLQPETVEVDGRTVALDPYHVTVRVGVAYQSGNPNVEGLLEKAIHLAESAKTAPHQLLCVEYTP
ncbi:hypothetical protein COV20_01375 [Candidatus Woesearchaeota archaeon CG10_big_fil_rev_8_21_14_0_10_45_16]|nr:MAG: hypothetical protein COV20_01375 [Candidatus Woesearchaeota archaeon CG10_big_fil_rev_8_21_14_0_10_45_16]